MASVGSLRHPALEPPVGLPLSEVDLSDRERVGVIFQGAALLAHLERGGWRLAEGWDGARVDGEGLLRGVEAEFGRSPVPPETHLRRMVGELFGAEEVAGRGQARRAIRRLVSRWRDGFFPGPARRIPRRILTLAPFLWEPSEARSRVALAAVAERDGEEEIWLCVPSTVRNRIRAVAGDLAETRSVLTGPEFRELWHGPTDRDPRSLAADGRWREAILTWESRGVESPDDRMAFAEALYARGRFQSALEQIQSLRRPEARCLALRCSFYLGRLEAGRRIARALEDRSVPGEVLLSTAEMAVRLYANLGEPEPARRWRDRALEEAPPSSMWRARLIAAEEAWDAEELDRCQEHLEAARDALEEPSGTWRWHQVAALLALGRNEPREVVRHTGAALRADRRRLKVVEAAGLWNDHAMGRLHLGDLARAEKAIAHAARLLAETEGPRRDTLALRNLAELRLRRGRLHGVREILERSRARNRRDGSLRALAEDEAAWARFEMVQGRALAAVETCRAVRRDLEAEGSTWHRPELAVLEGRALGWCERPDDAREALEAATEEAWRQQLEAEEWPALWALAGERERALETTEPEVRPIWESVLTGETVSAEAWEILDSIEPYRAGRWVWDLELVAPGVVPPRWRRRALRALRRVGAGTLAGRLGARLEGPWEALRAFLADGDVDGKSVTRLFAGMGLDEARLVRRRDGTVEVLVEGSGGEAELVVPHGKGLLELSVSEADSQVRALLELVAKELSVSRPEEEPRAPVLPGIVGESPELEAALEPLPALARGRMPIVVLGESGTGKELVARQVHRLSPRSEGSFVVMNCAEISESLVLSKLFGHVRGAFTGADRDRMGIFETARGGTVFLDEIGDLPLHAQGMLLRVLQEGEVVRVGESLPRTVEVRVVTATHRDLETMVEEGRFRQDLYFRLRVAVVELPPLRDRGDDVLLLAEYFLRRLAPEFGRRKLSREARRRIRAHPWPGNVRELEGQMEVAAALAVDGTIRPEHLRLPEEAAEPTGDYHRQIEDLRRRLVSEALKATDGNQAEAARRLGLTRQALSYLVRKLEIDV